jgi:hypothetical protein
LCQHCLITESRDSTLGTAMSYGLDGGSSIPGRGNILLFSIAPRPALGPTKLSTQWVPGALPPGIKLTTHLYLVLRLRMVELYLHSPICIQGVVLN